MNSGELIDNICKRTTTPKDSVKKVLAEFYNTVKTEVKLGRKVSVAGFGVFESMERKGRTGRNPMTGDKVRIPKKKVPKFRPGKNFKELLVKKKRKTKSTP
jgi:DNA-binding protein HU-beta